MRTSSPTSSSGSNAVTLNAIGKILEVVPIRTGLEQHQVGTDGQPPGDLLEVPDADGTAVGAEAPLARRTDPSPLANRAPGCLLGEWVRAGRVTAERPDDLLGGDSPHEEQTDPISVALLLEPFPSRAGGPGLRPANPSPPPALVPDRYSPSKQGARRPGHPRAPWPAYETTFSQNWSSLSNRCVLMNFLYVWPTAMFSLFGIFPRTHSSLPAGLPVALASCHCRVSPPAFACDRCGLADEIGIPRPARIDLCTGEQSCSYYL
jgi:hypothetical protein